MRTLGLLYTPYGPGLSMAKGLKQTSGPIVVSFSVAETVAGTMVENQINLQLNILDREVFVVTGTNLDISPPDSIAGISTRVRGSLSTTSRATIGDLADNNVIAQARDDIRMDPAAVGLSGVTFSQTWGETPAVGMDHLAIIATNDFFVQIEGNGNLGLNFMSGKLYGFRGIADADTFAALTQSELLSQ